MSLPSGIPESSAQSHEPAIGSSAASDSTGQRATFRPAHGSCSWRRFPAVVSSSIRRCFSGDEIPLGFAKPIRTVSISGRVVVILDLKLELMVRLTDEDSYTQRWYIIRKSVNDHHHNPWSLIAGSPCATVCGATIMLFDAPIRVHRVTNVVFAAELRVFASAAQQIHTKEILNFVALLHLTTKNPTNK